MTPPPGYGTAAWIFDMTGDPDPYIVTMGFAATTDADALDFIEEMAISWVANLRSSMTTAITLRETRGQYNDAGVLKDHVVTSGQAGTGGTGVLPQNCALLVKKVTGIGGRKNRGRMYWPAILGDTSVDALGVISSGVVTALQGHFDDVYDDLTSADFGPAILHADNSTPTIVLGGFTVESTIATQRRRLR